MGNHQLRTLIIAPHMDDESLSCGGLILRRVEDKCDVRVLTVFGRSYDYGRVSVRQSFAEEKEDFLNAMKVLGVPLGVTNFGFLNQEEGEPGKVGYYQILEHLEYALGTFNPDEVVIPSADDLNQDHRFLHEVCRIALRPANLCNVYRILVSRAFDTSLSDPTYYVPLTREQLDRKLCAVSAYRRERRKGAHPRSPQNIEAAHRLYGSKCGCEFAEGYNLLLSKE